jgi:hypothetical protein
MSKPSNLEEDMSDPLFTDDGMIEESTDIQDADKAPLEVEDLPDGEDEAEAQPQAAAPDDDAESRAARVTADAEQRALNAEARSVVIEAQAEARVVDGHRNQAKLAVNTLNEKMADARRQYKEARDAGDTAAELALEDSIKDMAGLKQQIEQTVASLPDERQLIANAQYRAQAIVQSSRGTSVNATTKAMNPTAEKWAKANAWFQDPGHGQAHAYVVNTSGALVREGWDPQSPGFYAELSRRVGGAFPSLKVAAIPAARTNNGKPQSKMPVAPTRSSSGGAPATRNTAVKYTLTAGDLSAMGRMNLDKNNPAHRAAFAKERLSSAKRAAS